MENENTLKVETESHTELGKRLVEYAQRLDKWCEAETDITHRQARVVIGLTAVAGAYFLLGWDNARLHNMLTKDMNIVSAGGEQVYTHFGKTNLVSLVKGLIKGAVEVHEYPGGNWTRMHTVDLSPEQRQEAVDALLKVEGRQAAKIFAAQTALFAGAGVMIIGGFLGGREKIKGSTGTGQWVARVMKSVGEVL